MFNNFMNFIRRLNRENTFFFQTRVFKFVGLIKVQNKIQNLSSISLKLWVLGKKNTRTQGVNTTIVVKPVFNITVKCKESVIPL